ncbi:MAG: hypothetical protein BHW06_00070 [Clostridium sp. 44_14]|nr:MAG: hypothetical protein BHW06_00070 [Clostridium sp. 44_14]
MARRKSDSPQKAAMREMMQGYLKENDISIKSGNDVNSIMRDMMSVLLEKNWAIPNTITATKRPITAGMDIPGKQCVPVMGIWTLQYPGTAKGSMNRS